MNASHARGLIAWLLRRSRFHGVTLPPFGIYVLPERMHDEQLIRHEQVHWAQYKHMGLVKFYLTYLYQVFRYGYENAPMEVEARKA